MNEDHNSLRACGAPALASTNTGPAAPLSVAGASWEPVADAVLAAITAQAERLTQKAADDFYASLLYSVQDYLCENAAFNIGSRIAAADRQARGDRLALQRERRATLALLAALKETWRVLRAAGTINLSNGVQLGQTSWYVKISDAEALSDAAIAIAEGCASPDNTYESRKHEGEAEVTNPLEGRQ